MNLLLYRYLCIINNEYLYPFLEVPPFFFPNFVFSSLTMRFRSYFQKCKRIITNTPFYLFPFLCIFYLPFSSLWPCFPFISIGNNSLWFTSLLHPYRLHNIRVAQILRHDRLLCELFVFHLLSTSYPKIRISRNIVFSNLLHCNKSSRNQQCQFLLTVTHQF